MKFLSNSWHSYGKQINATFKKCWCLQTIFMYFNNFFLEKKSFMLDEMFQQKGYIANE